MKREAQDAHDTERPCKRRVSLIDSALNDVGVSLDTLFSRFQDDLARPLTAIQRRTLADSWAKWGFLFFTPDKTKTTIIISILDQVLEVVCPKMTRLEHARLLDLAVTETDALRALCVWRSLICWKVKFTPDIVYRIQTQLVEACFGYLASEDAALIEISIELLLALTADFSTPESSFNKLSSQYELLARHLHLGRRGSAGVLIGRLAHRARGLNLTSPLKTLVKFGLTLLEPEFDRINKVTLAATALAISSMLASQSADSQMLLAFFDNDGLDFIWRILGPRSRYLNGDRDAADYHAINMLGCLNSRHLVDLQITQTRAMLCLEHFQRCDSAQVLPVLRVLNCIVWNKFVRSQEALVALDLILDRYARKDFEASCSGLVIEGLLRRFASVPSHAARLVRAKFVNILAR